MSLLSRIDDPVAMEKIRSLRPGEGLLPDADALARCKNLVRNLGKLRKD
jgi:hypothetical protein